MFLSRLFPSPTLKFKKIGDGEAKWTRIDFTPRIDFDIELNENVFIGSN